MAPKDEAQLPVIGAEEIPFGGGSVAKNLVIVESPAKAKTITKFLGRDFTVRASMGHVRDLPKSQFGVDVENGFEPKYITVRGQGKTLQELRKAASKAERVYLATDPDREGEAISWHLSEALHLSDDRTKRVEFHEITKKAVQNAIKNPRSIDRNLVDAQQARRILDRLVGYRLSPLLWNKVRGGLSAGRVQSVALRLICDREQEIDEFEQEEYWSITALLAPAGGPNAGETFEAKLHRLDGKKVEIGSEEEARAVVERLGNEEFRVESVSRKERKRNPAPPFTTSTLQQEASRRLGFTAKKTMSLAQQLYEGLELIGEGTVGLITYLRTDATRVSEEAQAEARAFIEEKYGKSHRPEKPYQYKSRSGAQAAHEAIRPTSVARTPDKVKASLTRDQHRLYRLIWERFLASQMSPAVLDTVTVDVKAGEGVFRATGSSVKFPGFMTVYLESKDDEHDESEGVRLPELTDGQAVECRKLDPKQHFTQPPPRYTEAMLVKTLEELGIGRPSTYVSIIDTIQRRGYVALEEKRFVPTELGNIIVDLLKTHFPDIVDVEFTANLEGQLDRIEEGELDWRGVLESFYQPFEQALQNAKDEIEEVEIQDEVTSEVCEACGRNMVIKWGRYGKFLACPGFPECRNTRPLLEEIGVDCPKCNSPLVERRSRRGRVFYGCSAYPECDFTSWKRPIARKCPACGSLMTEVVRKTKRDRHECTNKECGYSEDAPEGWSRDGDGAHEALQTGAAVAPRPSENGREAGSPNGAPRPAAEAKAMAREADPR